MAMHPCIASQAVEKQGFSTALPAQGAGPIECLRSKRSRLRIDLFEPRVEHLRRRGLHKEQAHFIGAFDQCGHPEALRATPAPRGQGTDPGERRLAGADLAHEARKQLGLRNEVVRRGELDRGFPECPQMKECICRKLVPESGPVEVAGDASVRRSRITSRSTASKPLADAAATTNGPECARLTCMRPDPSGPPVTTGRPDGVWPMPHVPGGVPVA